MAVDLRDFWSFAQFLSALASGIWQRFQGSYWDAVNLSFYSNFSTQSHPQIPPWHRHQGIHPPLDLPKLPSVRLPHQIPSVHVCKVIPPHLGSMCDNVFHFASHLNERMPKVAEHSVPSDILKSLKFLVDKFSIYYNTATQTLKPLAFKILLRTLKASLKAFSPSANTEKCWRCLSILLL